MGSKGEFLKKNGLKGGSFFSLKFEELFFIRIDILFSMILHIFGGELMNLVNRFGCCSLAAKSWNYEGQPCPLVIGIAADSWNIYPRKFPQRHIYRGRCDRSPRKMLKNQGHHFPFFSSARPNEDSCCQILLSSRSTFCIRAALKGGILWQVSNKWPHTP